MLIPGFLKRFRSGLPVKPGALLIIAALLPAGCASVPERPAVPASSKKALIVALARHEWIYFGRQKIRYDDGVETISPVGSWEDDDPQSERVQRYWRSVGKPDLTGKDCREPWSAAFISWVMQAAGVPAEQFLPSIAHWMYLADTVRNGSSPDRYFVARTLDSYAPQPGDLICATRADTRLPASDTLPTPDRLRNAKLHCNLVVDVDDRELLAIGGNVRNSVSQVALPLDAQGHLESSPQHAWFLIVQNRVP